MEIMSIYYEATELARQLNQTAGPKNDYYITLEQLMDLLAKVN